MSDLMQEIADIVYAGVPAYEATKERVSWPTCGSCGLKSEAQLAEYQRHDPSGRAWVGVNEQPIRYVDQFINWFGPVVEENDDYIVLDLGFTPFATFPKSRITVRRAA